MAGTTQDVLRHDLACFGKGDLGGIMEDYTAASSLPARSRLTRPSSHLCSGREREDQPLRWSGRAGGGKCWERFRKPVVHAVYALRSMRPTSGGRPPWISSAC